MYHISLYTLKSNSSFSTSVDYVSFTNVSVIFFRLMNSRPEKVCSWVSSCSCCSICVCCRRCTTGVSYVLVAV